jgi:hypothetical protein
VFKGDPATLVNAKMSIEPARAACGQAVSLHGHGLDHGGPNTLPSLASP